ncbi:hypothetical protein BD324DRAFT_173455 [Kockovaella imperatae]|uniref:Uncharacterized protein n=1 Tax=Kockovaella imperatae TaxID=4999 RepID=A0A1Y1U866_9TREE|nr:hypothetical protein BD324DRAFT_173455 [Kockovaella imperatae]ORX34231.1 hypothetical protein BD324DRAFT_173455 [Kockovaella imperatae]
MAIKRSPSPALTPSPSGDTQLESSPKAASPKKAKSSSGSPKKSKNTSTNGSSGGGVAAGVWTAEKFAVLSEEFMALASEHMDKEQIAQKLGVSKSQLVDQLKPNRANFRRKFMEWAKGGVNQKDAKA